MSFQIIVNDSLSDWTNDIGCAGAIVLMIQMILQMILLNDFIKGKNHHCGGGVIVLMIQMIEQKRTRIIVLEKGTIIIVLQKGRIFLVLQNRLLLPCKTDMY